MNNEGWIEGQVKPSVAGSVVLDNDLLIRRPVVALGYQSKDGTIVVTDVLCMNFPAMTNKQMAKLSWRLDQWSNGR